MQLWNQKPTESDLCQVNNLYFLKKLGPHRLSVQIWCYAAEFGRVEIMQFLFNEEVPFHPETSYWAAWHNHIPCLEFIVQHGLAWDQDTTKAAAMMCNMDVILWAEANHQRLHPRTYDLYNFF